MEKSPLNSKAIVYTSRWSSEENAASLEKQSVELQTYCIMNGLELVDIISDFGPQIPGRMRPNLERLVTVVRQQGIGHVIIHDVGRVGRNANEIMTFLRDTFAYNPTVIHVNVWKMTTASPEFSKLLELTSEILQVETFVDTAQSEQDLEIKRLKPLWIKIFAMLQDERYAEVLLKALFQLKDATELNKKESLAVHGGYDHLNMFSALGFRIKGEQTDNTKLVTDVMVRVWDQLKQQLGSDLHKLIESSETNAFL